MFTFEDIKMMYDWGCFTDQQVSEFAPMCISEEQVNQIISKPA